MNPEQEAKLQNLLRVKQQERPPEGYFEDFLAEFQTRQRRDLLKRSLFSEIGERISDFCQLLTRPRVLVPAFACYAAVMLLLQIWPRPSHLPTTNKTLVVTIPQQSNPQLQTLPTMQGGIPVIAVPAGSDLNSALPPAPQNSMTQTVGTGAHEQRVKRSRIAGPEFKRTSVGEPLPEQHGREPISPGQAPQLREY
jgi:hypothetical protein